MRNHSNILSSTSGGYLYEKMAKNIYILSKDKKYMIFSKVQTLYLCLQSKQTSINIIYVIFIQNIHT